MSLDIIIEKERGTPFDGIIYSASDAGLPEKGGGVG